MSMRFHGGKEPHITLCSQKAPAKATEHISLWMMRLSRDK